MTGEIRNPAKLPTDLNSAEKKFAHCLAEGKPCIIGNGDFSTPRPEEGIESGEGANVVRGEVIRFFAYGGNEENPVLGPLIHLRGAWISGVLNLTHASIPYVLDFSNCHFAVSVRMQCAKCAALYLTGSHLAQGLLADGLTTKGVVYLHKGFSAEGEVRLLGANIGGYLSCTGGKFHNPGGNALLADGLMTKGNVVLQGDFSSEGGVRLLGADIGGDLSCDGGRFHNADGEALSADRLITKGSVHLRDGFFAKGEVRLLGANIGGNLSCTGGEFHKPDGNALTVDGGHIRGGLFLRNITCKGNIDLTYTRADVLADDLDSWKSCKIFLDGFTYSRFFNPTSASFRIDWLAKRPDGAGFSPLPYEQAANVLFGMGYIRHAQEILRAKERLQTKYGKMHWLRRFGRRLWDVFAGYGYCLHYTAAWMAFFVAIGAGIFDVADRCGNIVPTHPVVALNEDYRGKVAPYRCNLRPTQAVEPEYPAFNPFMFSLDVFMPSAVFHQEDSWGPRSGGGDWLDFDVDILWFLTLWYWFQIFMGWVLTSLFLLSVYDSLRPRQLPGARK